MLSLKETDLSTADRVCRKEEKVRRLNEILPNVEVENVYSDSIDHDRYIFALGKHCYLATKGNLKEIDFESAVKQYDEQKAKKKHNKSKKHKTN